MKHGSPTPTFRPDIEGLRAIAVLIVVLYHSGVPGFSGGFIGVDVFFVLSGYLITGLLVKEVETTSRLNLLNFYARRIRRLLPASALMLLLTLMIGALILAPAELTFAARAARASAIYMSNMFFSINAADYFAPRVESNPILHTWSLAVEEQFYLFWPLLIALGLVVFKSRKVLWSLLASLTVISLAVCVWSTANGGTFAFYELPARAWEFGIGGLAARPLAKATLVRSGWWIALGCIGVGIILGCATSMTTVGFPGLIALVPATGTIAALVAGAAAPGRGAALLLNSAPMQTLGGLSYSWYLWHWPFLVGAKALYPDISVAGRLAAVAISLLIAAITHHFIENPIRFHPKLTAKPIRSIYYGAAVTILSVVAASSALRFAAWMADTPDMKAVTASIDDIARMPRQECLTLGESPEVKTCEFGDRSSSTNIVLFGDSHAVQWFNPIERMAKQRSWKLTTLVKSGCPAAGVAIPGSSPRFTASCNQWRAAAIRRAVESRPSAVLIASAAVYIKRKGEPEHRPAVSLEDWRIGTRRTLQALADSGLRAVLIRDIPRFSFDVPTCLARSIRHSWYPGKSCQVARDSVLDPAVFEAEKAAGNGFDGIRFLDLTDQFCGPDVCMAVQRGDVMYRDDNHVTGTFADRLLPVLEDRLMAALNARL